MTKLQVAGVALSLLIGASLAGCQKPKAPEAPAAEAAAPAAAPAPEAAAPVAPPAADPSKPAPDADTGGEHGNPHPQ